MIGPSIALKVFQSSEGLMFPVFCTREGSTGSMSPASM
jgi:hypothetical protein